MRRVPECDGTDGYLPVAPPLPPCPPVFIPTQPYSSEVMYSPIAEETPRKQQFSEPDVVSSDYFGSVPIPSIEVAHGDVTLHNADMTDADSEGDTETEVSSLNPIPKFLLHEVIAPILANLPNDLLNMQLRASTDAEAIILDFARAARLLEKAERWHPFGKDFCKEVDLFYKSPPGEGWNTYQPLVDWFDEATAARYQHVKTDKYYSFYEKDKTKCWQVISDLILRLRVSTEDRIRQCEERLVEMFAGRFSDAEVHSDMRTVRNTVKDDCEESGCLDLWYHLSEAELFPKLNWGGFSAHWSADSA